MGTDGINAYDAGLIRSTSGPLEKPLKPRHKFGGKDPLAVLRRPVTHPNGKSAGSNGRFKYRWGFVVVLGDRDGVRVFRKTNGMSMPESNTGKIAETWIGEKVK